jgi:hypothetical protein
MPKQKILTTVGPTIERIKQHVKEADRSHATWWETAEKAYQYNETNQKPEQFPDRLKLFAQINRIAESHDTRMGMYSSAKAEFTVQGRGGDNFDKDRVSIVQSVLNWVLGEAGIEEELLMGLSDFDLAGLASIRCTYDKYKITHMGTLGMARVERLHPRNFRMDPGGVLHTGLDGRYSIYKKELTLYEFQDEYAGYEQDGKEIDIEAIFERATTKDGMDAEKNSGKGKHDRRLTICEYEYYLIKPKVLVHPVTGDTVQIGEGNNKRDLKVPTREYRVKLLAGDTELNDFESEISKLNYWRKIFFPNNGRHDGPYSDGPFVRERPVNDLINTMVSMSINAQARNMSGPWMFLKGSITDINAWMKDAADGKPLEYDYTQDMKEAGVPSDMAVPRRDAPGQMDMGWFRMMDWIFNKYENVSVKEVLQGEAAPGVKSGYGISLLQNTGMQPNYYAKAKLEAPLKRVGEAVWACIQMTLPDEIELPVKGETGEVEGITINHIVTSEEMKGLMYLSNPDNPDVDQYQRERAIQALNLISVRDGEDRISLKEFSRENPEKAKAFAEGEDLGEIEFVQNDIQFGDYDVGLVIDQLAEQNKRERIMRIQTVLPIIQTMNPRVALEYALKALNEPKAYEILKKIDKGMQPPTPPTPAPGTPGTEVTQPGQGAPQNEESSIPQASDVVRNAAAAGPASSPQSTGGPSNGMAENSAGPGGKVSVPPRGEGQA